MRHTLVDIAYAPLFMRSNLLNLADTLYPKQDYPKIASWEEQLLGMPELPNFVISDFDTVLKSHLKQKAPYAASQLGL